MSTVKVNDINIYYEIHGEGEPLVLIMGLGGDHFRWFRILPLLAENFKVFTFDNRGVGKTDKPDIPYSMEMMSDDVAGLMDAVGIEKAHVFGISLGGMIAQNFALLHPDRIISLVLGCTFCGGKHTISSEERTGPGVLDPSLIETMLPEERAVEMLPALYSLEFIDNNQDFVDIQIEYAKNNPPDIIGYRRQMGAAGTHNTYDRLPEIKIPTLVIAGDKDVLISVDNSRLIASRIPNAELVILKGMGHGFYTEANVETARILTDFIKYNSLR
ncbi:MAG: alpha/beta hydrolase [Dehalococcoidales bacterium]|nr:MAG: alpha/beta hydrolase [Dehalococcoidales bacterium]